MVTTLRYRLGGIGGFESEVALGDITYADDNGRNHALCQDGIQVQVFHQELQQEVVEDEVEYKRQEIPKQLNTPPEITFGKHYEFVEQETDDEGAG